MRPTRCDCGRPGTFTLLAGLNEQRAEPQEQYEVDGGAFARTVVEPQVKVYGAKA
jgi:hypothetical protein